MKGSSGEDDEGAAAGARSPPRSSTAPSQASPSVVLPQAGGGSSGVKGETNRGSRGGCDTWVKVARVHHLAASTIFLFYFQFP